MKLKDRLSLAFTRTGEKTWRLEDSEHLTWVTVMPDVNTKNERPLDKPVSTRAWTVRINQAFGALAEFKERAPYVFNIKTSNAVCFSFHEERMMDVIDLLMQCIKNHDKRVNDKFNGEVM